MCVRYEEEEVRQVDNYNKIRNLLRRITFNFFISPSHPSSLFDDPDKASRIPLRIPAVSFYVNQL